MTDRLDPLADRSLVNRLTRQLADALERVQELERENENERSHGDAMAGRADEFEQDNATLRSELDALRLSHDRLIQRAERLEAALREIASCESHVPGDVVDVARTALADAPVAGREGEKSSSRMTYYEAGVVLPDEFRVRRSMRVHIRQPDDPDRDTFQWSLCGRQLRTGQTYRGWIVWRRCSQEPAADRVCSACARRAAAPAGEGDGGR